MDSENMAALSAKSPSEHSSSEPSRPDDGGGIEKPAAGPLDWDSPDDPDNPWNWPAPKRWFGTIVPGCFCFLV